MVSAHGLIISALKRVVSERTRNFSKTFGAVTEPIKDTRPGNRFGQRLTINEEVGKFKTSVLFAFHRRNSPTYYRWMFTSVPVSFNDNVFIRLLYYYNLSCNGNVKFHIKINFVFIRTRPNFIFEICL